MNPQNPHYPPIPPPPPMPMPYGMSPVYGYQLPQQPTSKAGKVGLVIGLIALVPWLVSWMLILVASGTGGGGPPKTEEFMLAFAIMGCIGLSLLLALPAGILGIIACATARPPQPMNFAGIAAAAVVFGSYVLGMMLA
jgi:hypothetical protein